jgi:DNA-binding response OmpR family regulator
MKKILIVDGHQPTRKFLETNINRYCTLAKVSVDLHWAKSSEAAVELYDRYRCELIFIAVTLHRSEGIELISRLYALNPEALIIIVFNQSSKEYQLQALRNGAKDFFVHPILPHEFTRRLSHYFSMIESEKGLPSFKQSRNLFTNAIYCYKAKYRIENEEDLAQLWESLLFHLKESVRADLLSDLIRFLYQIGQQMLGYKVHPRIVMEENEIHYFFTILNIHILPSVMIVKLIDDTLSPIEYRMETNTLSFKISKETGDTPSGEAQGRGQHRTREEKKETQPLYRYDFMENKDLELLEMKLNQLSTDFIWMGTNELDLDDVEHIVHAFERISVILLLYTQTHTLGTSIKELTHLIKNEEKRFMVMAPQMAKFCKDFNKDLIAWCKHVFYTGAPSVDFMDASLLSNLQLIKSFLEPIASAPLERP